MKEFLIYGEIGEWGVEAKEVVAFLQKAKEDKEDAVVFRVNSIGGDVFDAIAIANQIEAAEMKTTAIIDSIAASSAGYIVCAADWVKAAEDASFMLHNPRPVWAEGDADTLQTLVNTLRQYEATFKKRYAKKTGLSEEELTDLMAGDEGTLMTAQEALKLGFVDEIIEPLKIDAKAPKKFLAKYKKPEKKQTSPQKINIRSKAMTRAELITKYTKEGFSEEQIDALLLDAAEMEEEGGTTDTKESCEAAGKHWYGDACHDEPEPVTEKAEAVDEEGATPETEADCKAADKYWYGDACHDEPEPATEEAKAVARLQEQLTVQSKQLAAQAKVAGNLIKALAVSESEKVFANYQMPASVKADIRKLVCHKPFVKDGALDAVAYKKAIAAKAKDWGTSNVDGISQTEWDEKPVIPEGHVENNGGYTADYILGLKGKKGK